MRTTDPKSACTAQRWAAAQGLGKTRWLLVRGWALESMLEPQALYILAVSKPDAVSDPQFPHL